jgi:hypothetical protein
VDRQAEATGLENLFEKRIAKDSRWIQTSLDVFKLVNTAGEHLSDHDTPLGSPLVSAADDLMCQH